MDLLIWIGATISLLGLAGLVGCILSVLRARRAEMPEQELRERIQAVLPLNLGALFLSVIGLMLIIVGIVLG